MEDSKASEALIPLFKLERLLNQDQGGRRITLLGTINSEPALLTAERAAFPSSSEALAAFHACLSDVKNLGTNDIYHWYLASINNQSQDHVSPDLKLNLIHPCTEKHVKKYSPQGLRMVTETPEIYRDHIRSYIVKQREAGRLDWVFNILEGRKEQKDIIYRNPGQDGTTDEAFLLAPDLNWDRETLTSMHLLGLVQRRDIWSVRDLKKEHVVWLKHMREKILEATVQKYPSVEKDQPTFYHLHIHVVHINLEPTGTQATGKAFGLENIIAQLETMDTTTTAGGMADVTLTYTLGESHDLWKEIFLPLKEAGRG
ncbi:MAG: hypothetical protein LQ350_000428 [Teloschistes chrysophthalmus]|nr:MAG: hypothetical protein LQ350_000428 [Niorma chrysophthalma]